MTAAGSDWQETCARAAAHSPFLNRALDQQPAIADLLRAGEIDVALEHARTVGNGEPVRRALRLEKQALALVVGIADLAGAFALADVTRHLSDFADRALDRAIAAIYADRYPDAQSGRGFAVISLGKHGSRELNYSSDIDPIFITDPETLPTRGREDAADAARRIGQALVKLLSDRDADGYVFRVDMRLRPSPEVSPVALPVDAAIGYYESSALNWEQAAFIRARACAGDRALGARFLATLEPFVWRRSLDYGAIRSVGEMSARIRDHYDAGQEFGPGYDLKRGRGGIREVEFFAQAHQLVFGGRQRALRAPDTIGALAALAEAERIGAAEAADMTAAYRMLRTVEHRLQMVDDRQTHSLPDRPDALDNVARLHGLADGEALLALLAPHVERVGDLYDGMIEASESDGHLPDESDRLRAALAAAGVTDADAFVAAIQRWRSGRVATLKSAAARGAFETLLPDLVEALGRAPDPPRALTRFAQLIERLPTAINFFDLLNARPALLEQVAAILSHAPTLADALAQRSELLDGLIDATALDLPPSVEEIEAELAGLAPRGSIADDTERLLDRVRMRVGERRFALGVQMVGARHDALAIAEGYARVAEAAVRVLTRGTVKAFETAHGRVEGSEFVMLALGRLGGGALTHASDLDLVFLFTGTHEATSDGGTDGGRALGATQYFNRLASRVVAALSVPTAAGPLYDIDTRLRPSGKQGPLAVTVASFLKYQRESAWTWEHMALTRARVVYGGAPAADDLSRGIAAVLALPREPEELRRAVRQMRLDIVANKPPKGPLDAKLLEGGLVDWEFIVHFMQLKTGKGLDPALERAAAALIDAGLLPPAMADAHRDLTRLLVALRLMAPGCDIPPPASRGAIARAAGQANWDKLLDSVAAARHAVTASWNDLLRPSANDRLGAAQDGEVT